MERYICIHCHFYQPPRENPWFESIEQQESARPYHDWNARITAECYGPNSLSRILDGSGRIKEIVNNYASVSFNFGPTVLSWLIENSPETYQAIIEADRLSVKKRSGHGNAIAQIYNHMIMPLASRRDKKTQILWGIRDFEYRFKRRPEGMWLPETAVDMETLEMVSSAAIKFTVLAQHQAKRVRALGSQKWKELLSDEIDPRMPYLVRLSGGKTLGVFFYNGPVSKAVAFENLLESGENFAERLLKAFSEKARPEIVNIATDGESYGHHHVFGDMALAYGIKYIEAGGLARLTNYGEYLAKHPPRHEVEIAEDTSWSCAHGVERWRSDCGCSVGGRPGWTQRWRSPLRASFDFLRDEVSVGYEAEAGRVFKDPSLAREDYIYVMLDRSGETVERFLEKHAFKGRSDKSSILKLLELQRHLMLMYTSCGWFFADISGIETVQVLRYAARAMELAGETLGLDIEKKFLAELSRAKSNLPEEGTGKDIYARYVKPSVIGQDRVAAHYGINCLFTESAEEARLYCYGIRKDDYLKIRNKDAWLSLGKLHVVSRITWQSGDFTFFLLRLGDTDFNCGVSDFKDRAAYDETKKSMILLFEKGKFSDVLGLIKKLSGRPYCLRDLFRDEQTKVLGIIADGAIRDLIDAYKRLYWKEKSLMGYLSDMSLPLAEEFLGAAGFALIDDLKDAVRDNGSDIKRLRDIYDELGGWGLSRSAKGISSLIEKRLEDMLSGEPDEHLLGNIERLLLFASEAGVELNLWKAQNIYYRMSGTVYKKYLKASESEDGHLRAWIKSFRHLGKMLNFNTDAVLGR